ncbi:MAG: hypothetical protein GF384_02295, partial [Elusimicrobia bacterium]|nr:hypothetical protein [Elusimicrobiota bacterium]MBD3411807.1 hypothetical protein [Elusimicrobiota bacterium]
DDKTIDIAVTPVPDTGREIGIIGIFPAMTLQKVGVFEGMRLGIGMVGVITTKTIEYIVGRIVRFEKPKEVSGPIGIFKFISDAAQAGFRELFSLLGLLSVAIGLFNLFPIPMLDGGHVVFYLIEGIIRRPLSQRTMIIANYVGMIILLTILLYASYNDILRISKKSPVPEEPSVTSTE